MNLLVKISKNTLRNFFFFVTQQEIYTTQQSRLGTYFTITCQPDVVRWRIIHAPYSTHRDLSKSTSTEVWRLLIQKLRPVMPSSGSPTWSHYGQFFHHCSWRTCFQTTIHICIDKSIPTAIWICITCTKMTSGSKVVSSWRVNRPIKGLVFMNTFQHVTHQPNHLIRQTKYVWTSSILDLSKSTSTDAWWLLVQKLRPVQGWCSTYVGPLWVVFSLQLMKKKLSTNVS